MLVSRAGGGVTAPRTVESVTCLGCGCACDDLKVRVENGRIVDVTPTCPIARDWFGDGSVPAEVKLGGKPAGFEEFRELIQRFLTYWTEVSRIPRNSPA